MIWQMLITAAVTGVLLAILLSLLSYFVVMRRMTFAGVGVAHSAFGGVALNFILGLSGFCVPLLFSVAAALFIACMYRKGKVSEDSAIDLIFVFSMAFGVFVLSLSSGYTANLMGVLFGSILSVDTADLYSTIALFVVGFAFLSFYFSHFQLMTYNEELARISGVNVDFLYYAFWIVLSCVVVLAIKLIGIILVNAFLVLPTLTGMNVSRNYRGIIFFGMVFSTLSTTAGIFLAYLLNTPAGATIVLFYVLLWMVTLAFKRLFLKV